MFRHMLTAYAAAMLSSERIRLEPITYERAKAMLSGLPEADLPWAKGFPLPALHGVLERIVTTQGTAFEQLHPYFAYVIVRNADGLAVGDAGFHGPPSVDGEVEVGYALVPEARGAGLATEAVELLATWARRQPGVERVVARVDPGNAPSHRVLERLGFQQDGKRGGLTRYVL